METKYEASFQRGRAGSGEFLLEKEKVHEKADRHAERNGSDRSGHSHLDPENPCRENDGEHVDGRA